VSDPIDPYKEWVPASTRTGSDYNYVTPTYDGAQIGWTGRADDQYLRKWSLSLGKAPIAKNGGNINAPGYHGGVGVRVVEDAFGQGVGDAEMITTETAGMDFRMTFKIRHADSNTPGTAEIRIYNLSNTTANKYIREMSTVVLSAGYIHGHFGVIFRGIIKQYKKGRESATDSYLDIYAADGDIAYRNTRLAEVFEAGHDGDKWQSDIAKAFANGSALTVGELQAVGAATTMSGLGPTTFRGGIMWGLPLDEGREFQRTTGHQFSIQNNVLQSIKSSAYKQGDVVIINSGTGMIGSPEVTEGGITVTCLLNPNVYVKQRVQLDNKTLNQFFLPGDDPDKAHSFVSTYGAYTMLPVPYAATNADGKYAILMIDHEGDTRGQAWYTHLTCLTLDETSGLLPAGLGTLDLL
jgi:hypothetical protein